MVVAVRPAVLVVVIVAFLIALVLYNRNGPSAAPAAAPSNRVEGPGLLAPGTYSVQAGFGTTLLPVIREVDAVTLKTSGNVNSPAKRNITVTQVLSEGNVNDVRLQSADGRTMTYRPVPSDRWALEKRALVWVAAAQRGTNPQGSVTTFRVTKGISTGFLVLTPIRDGKRLQQVRLKADFGGQPWENLTSDYIQGPSNHAVGFRFNASL